MLRVDSEGQAELLPWLLRAVTSAHEDQLLSGPKYQDPRSIARHRSQVYAQNGEDGAIAEIMRRIGEARGRFIEIGAGSGQQNNTRFLLECGWTGIWVEADQVLAAGIRAAFHKEIAAGALVVVEDLADRDNVAQLLKAAGAGESIDLLSIDIDMNTSHVWRSLRGFAVKAAVIEYNPSIPPSVEWEVPYHPRSMWGGDNFFGASLKTLQNIAEDQDMRLVGCDLTGINAFFVHGDFATSKSFLVPFTSEFHYEPPRFALSVCSAGHGPHRRAVEQAKLAA